MKETTIWTVGLRDGDLDRRKMGVRVREVTMRIAMMDSLTHLFCSRRWPTTMQKQRAATKNDMETTWMCFSAPEPVALMRDDGEKAVNAARPISTFPSNSIEKKKKKKEPSNQMDSSFLFCVMRERERAKGI